MFNKLITYLMLVMAMMVGSVVSAAEPSSTEVIVPSLTGRTVFLSKTANISFEEQNKITAALTALETNSKVAMVVLVVDSVKPFSIEEYSIKVAEKWKIGEKKLDNGIILIIAAEDRKSRLEVGYGLEGVVTDAMSNRITNDYMIPKFKEGKWADGIIEAIGRIGNLANNKPLDADLSPGHVAPIVNKNKSSSSSFNSSNFKNLDGDALIFGLILLVIVALFTTGVGKFILIGIILGGLISISRNTVGSVVSGILGGIVSGIAGFFLIDGWWIIAVIIGTFTGAFGISWLWHVLEILIDIASSSKGGSSYSSSSSGGGYSGGGGRFGGGGSSGSW